MMMTRDGGLTWTFFQRTFTFPSTGSAFADIAALLAEINTAGSWNGGTLPTQFVITNDGDKLVITSAIKGDLYGIQIAAASTAIGIDSDTDLLYVGDVYELGAGGTPVAGQGTNDLYFMSDANGLFIVSVANDQAEKTLVQVQIDDGILETLELTFT
jgi:hypothetical protein